MSVEQEIDTIEKYKAAVIDLFKSGKATDEQWRAMAEVVLRASEDDTFAYVECIDVTIYGECSWCGAPLFNGECICEEWELERLAKKHTIEPAKEPDDGTA